MESFIKLFADNSLLLIVIMEAILIIILVVVVFSKIKKVEIEKINNSDLYNRYNRDIKNWQTEYYNLRDTYIKVYRELNALKNERRWQNGQAPRSNYDHSRRNVNPNEESNKGWDEFIRNENKKLNRVEETTNDDGTVKSEICFNLVSDDPIPVPISIKYEYLEAANGGQFRKLFPSDEKSFFRTWEENGVRKFEFHGNVDNALANFNAVFDDVCVIEGKQNGATQIINIDPGVLTSQLKVETPAKIKLI